jgi:hypothetical protein
MLSTAIVFPIAIGVAGAAIIWTLRRVVPAENAWLRPPDWLLEFWVGGIGIAIVVGGVDWVALF